MVKVKENNMENQDDLIKVIQSLKNEIEELKKSPRKIGPRTKKKYKPRVKKVSKIVQDDDKPGVRFRRNIFDDDGKLCKEDRDFDKKVVKKSARVPRERPPAQLNEVKCTRCNKIHKTYQDTTYYICPKCVRG